MHEAESFCDPYEDIPDEPMPFGLCEEHRPALERLARSLCRLLADQWLREHGHPEGIAALGPEYAPAPLKYGRRAAK